MELTLNLVWALLAAYLVQLWMVHARREGASRQTQLAALAMMLLILFPVISVTDDLLAAQNPAEVESSLRRDDGAMQAQPFFPAVAALPPAFFAAPDFGATGLAPRGFSETPAVRSPALQSIHNRPPPTA
jgi:hypothetical protein